MFGFRKKKIHGMIPPEWLLADLVRIAERYKMQSVTKKKYLKHGKYAIRQYHNRFGGWDNALSEAGLLTWHKLLAVRKDRRAVGARLRYKVLEKDNFKCVKCGASPATDAGVVLHIDHIVPFSKGGETVCENLQTLCSKCNFGKGVE
ncbi:MAG: HNH endonuclease [Christensenellaceae bacterium]|jgi:hypothetical protein|nr:HNH endonuclease [Christensenellaceae bacterium]